MHGFICILEENSLIQLNIPSVTADSVCVYGIFQSIGAKSNLLSRKAKTIKCTSFHIKGFTEVCGVSLSICRQI